MEEKIENNKYKSFVRLKKLNYYTENLERSTRPELGRAPKNLLTLIKICYGTRCTTHNCLANPSHLKTQEIKVNIYSWWKEYSSTE